MVESRGRRQREDAYIRRGCGDDITHLPLLHQLKLRLEEVELLLMSVLQPPQVPRDESDRTVSVRVRGWAEA